MSEETEVPIVCDDCGGNLTNAGGTIDDLFSMALGEDRPHYWHMEQSGCIASLNERLTDATQRAEAAEAERDALIRAIDDHCVTALQTTFERGGNAKQAVHDLMFWSQEVGEYFAKQEIANLRAECEALRKDAARYRWLKPQLEMDWDLGNPVYLSLGLTVEVPTHVEVSFDLDATIDAALAVQPTTGGGDE